MHEPIIALTSSATTSSRTLPKTKSQTSSRRLPRVVQLQRRDPQALLPEVGRVRVVRPRHGAADVGLVGGDHDPAERARPRGRPAWRPSSRRAGCRRVNGSLWSIDVALGHVAAEAPPRSRACPARRVAEHRDVLGLLEQHAVGVVDAEREVAALDEQRRARAALDDDAHALADRLQPAGDHRGEDRVVAGSAVSASGPCGAGRSCPRRRRRGRSVSGTTRSSWSPFDERRARRSPVPARHAGRRRAPRPPRSAPVERRYIRRARAAARRRCSRRPSCRELGRVPAAEHRRVQARSTSIGLPGRREAVELLVAAVERRLDPARPPASRSSSGNGDRHLVVLADVADVGGGDDARGRSGGTPSRVQRGHALRDASRRAARAPRRVERAPSGAVKLRT